MGFAQDGWKWARGSVGQDWHRCLHGRTACGQVAPPREGIFSLPTSTEQVCSECKRITGYRRQGVKRTARGRMAMRTVRVSVPAFEVRDVLAAGLDPATLLRDWWTVGVRRMRPLRPAEPPRGSREADALDSDRMQVREVAAGLLASHEGKGVPAPELRAALGWIPSRLRRVLGVSKTMRFGDRVTKGYPADRFEALAPSYSDLPAQRAPSWLRRGEAEAPEEPAEAE